MFFTFHSIIHLMLTFSLRLGSAFCVSQQCFFFCGSHALFTGPTSTFFSKNNFKTGSHDTIHIFKNYCVTVFSVFINKQYPNRPLISLFPNYNLLSQKLDQRKKNDPQVTTKLILIIYGIYIISY